MRLFIIIAAELILRDYSEISCRNIQMVRRTKRLLMLGYMQGVRRPAWFVIPRRVFEDERETELFLATLRDPRMPENEVDAMEQTAGGEREYLRFQYRLDGEKWAHPRMMKTGM